MLGHMDKQRQHKFFAAKGNLNSHSFIIYMNRILYLLIIPIVGTSALYAQTPTYKNYTVEDGLPSNETYAVFEDRQGYIWIATDRGVSKFDGYKFENFTTQDGLPGNTVFSFTEDAKGRIWFRTFNGNMGFYFDGSFTTLNTISFKSMITNMSIDSSGRFYVILPRNMYSFEFNEEWDTIRSKSYRKAADLKVNASFWENNTS